MKLKEIEIPKEALSKLCERRHIYKLAFFGSVLREDFTDASDLDLLVEFEPDHRIGLIGMAGIEAELSELLGRKVDLRTPGELSRYFRQNVLATAKTIYARG
ncbi:MAG: nucleotidyltransferase domain-containing protein [Nitrospinae bacterium]|nr:nucleotidyltransferase domain-containing protein [Nitrospinota bacterium]